MLTKNFYNALVYSGLWSNGANAIKAPDGTTYTYYATGNIGSNNALFFRDMYRMQSVVPAEVGCVMIGKGKTPPTADDYALESPITDGIAISYQTSVNITKNEDGIFLSNTYGVRNNGSQPLEVSEIGCFGVTKVHSGSTSVNKSFLFERTVLETPIVVPVDESRQITYTIALRYPTA